MDTTQLIVFGGIIAVVVIGVVIAARRGGADATDRGPYSSSTEMSAGFVPFQSPPDHHPEPDPAKTDGAGGQPGTDRTGDETGGDGEA